MTSKDLVKTVDLHLSMAQQTEDADNRDFHQQVAIAQALLYIGEQVARAADKLTELVQAMEASIQK